MRLFLIAIFIISATSTVARSGEDIPFTFPDEIKGKDIKGTLPARFKILSPVTLGQTTLDQAKDHFGNALTYRANNKDGAETVVCYTIPSGHAVQFKSGPMGAWSTITSILFTESGVYKNRNCANSDRLKQPLGVGGITLGLDKQTVMRLLGTPSYNAGRITEYKYDAETPGTPPSNGPFYILSGVRLSFNPDGKVEAFEVYWVVTT